MSKSNCMCQNYRKPKVGRFLRHGVHCAYVVKVVADALHTLVSGKKKSQGFFELLLQLVKAWYRDCVGKTAENSSIFCIIPLILLAVSKDMQAVKLCSSEIVQYLTWGCQLTQVDCIMVIKRLLLSLHLFTVCK